jgi:hypothetical protein
MFTKRHCITHPFHKTSSLQKKPVHQTSFIKHPFHKTPSLQNVLWQYITSLYKRPTCLKSLTQLHNAHFMAERWQKNHRIWGWFVLSSEKLCPYLLAWNVLLPVLLSLFLPSGIPFHCLSHAFCCRLISCNLPSCFLQAYLQRACRFPACLLPFTACLSCQSATNFESPYPPVFLFPVCLNEACIPACCLLMPACHPPACLLTNLSAFWDVLDILYSTCPCLIFCSCISIQHKHNSYMQGLVNIGDRYKPRNRTTHTCHVRMYIVHCTANTGSYMF